MHFFLPEFLNLFARHNTSDQTCNNQARRLLVGRINCLCTAFEDHLLFLLLLGFDLEILQEILVTHPALATTFVLLDHADCLNDVLVLQKENVVNNFLDGFIGVECLFALFLDPLVLLVLSDHLFLLLVLILLLLFLTLLGLLLLLFLFFLAASVDLLLENQVHVYAVVLCEVSWHRDLNHAGIVLEVKEQTVKMHIDGVRARVELTHLLFGLADADHG